MFRAPPFSAGDSLRGRGKITPDKIFSEICVTRKPARTGDPPSGRASFFISHRSPPGRRRPRDGGALLSIRSTALSACFRLAPSSRCRALFRRSRRLRRRVAAASPDTAGGTGPGRLVEGPALWGRTRRRRSRTVSRTHSIGPSAWDPSLPPDRLRGPRPPLFHLMHRSAAVCRKDAQKPFVTGPRFP